jgi:hypothetical protein
MLDLRLLKKLPTRYDASKVFKKGKKVYYYFSASLSVDNTYTYYLFNPQFSFTKNFELLQEKFKDIKGSWQLTTDNTFYPKPVLKESKHLQLELFS